MADAAKTLETFSISGAAVAILTDAMKKSFRCTLPLLAFALPAAAQQWSVGGGTGAFVFGEGQVTDIDTASPFEKSDFAAASLVKIPRTHNVHTTLGLRWRF
jgi:hypothetical protein